MYWMVVWRLLPERLALGWFGGRCGKRLRGTDMGGKVSGSGGVFNAC